MMQCPFPTKTKYLADYTAFAGWRITTVGELVDIEDREGDIITRIPKEAAEKIIEARDRFLSDIQSINESLLATQT